MGREEQKGRQDMMRPLRFKLEFIVPGLICQEERTHVGFTVEIGEDAHEVREIGGSSLIQVICHVFPLNSLSPPKEKKKEMKKERKQVSSKHSLEEWQGPA